MKTRTFASILILVLAVLIVNGSIWFQCHWECFTHGNSGHRLAKISDSGNTLEMLVVVGELRFEEWDPDSNPSLYSIYYRQ